jgi:hypothetical protein
VSHNGRRIVNTNGTAYFAQVVLKNKVPTTGVTMFVSVKYIYKAGTGKVLLGAITSDYLLERNHKSLFNNWISTISYLGYYSDDKSLRSFTVGYCDTGYMCRQQSGFHAKKFRANDVMIMEINLTEPVPQYIADNPNYRSCLQKSIRHWVMGTENGTGYVRYYKNGQQMGPTMYNIYYEDKKDPYDVIVAMNTLPGVTIDLVDVYYEPQYTPVFQDDPIVYDRFETSIKKKSNKCEIM